jgi:ankyrin repeat protein
MRTVAITLLIACVLVGVLSGINWWSIQRLETAQADLREELRAVRAAKAEDPEAAMQRLLKSDNIDKLRRLLGEPKKRTKEAYEGQQARLLEAVEQGEAKRVQEELGAGADVNGKDKDGETPLMKAAARGHIKIVRILIEHEAELNEVDNKGQTAMMHAAENGQTSVIVEAIPYDTDGPTERTLNMRDRKGMTALMKAAAKGHVLTVEAMLKRWPGGRINWTLKDVDGKTALNHAEEGGHKAAVTLLKEKDDKK